MKIYPVVLSGCALLLAAGVVNAADTLQANCTIRNVHLQAESITCEEGHQFGLAKGVSIDSLKPGMKVNVTYESKAGDSEDDGGGMIATQIRRE